MIRYDIAKSARGTWVHPILHSSYWHYLIFRTKETKNSEHYFAARPNAGAGIGHQLANWIAGYWWAQQFGLKYAHIPFYNSKWECFLGFGEQEAKAEDLLKEGYKKILLPYFDQHTNNEIAMVQGIIKSYSNQKVVFIAEQDQDYTNQQDLQAVLKKKFHAAPARKSDTLIYDSQCYNIAVHVRRTVVIDGIVTNETGKIKSRRWLASNYYEKVLQQVMDTLTVTKPIDIYLFSTGKPEEFADYIHKDEILDNLKKIPYFRKYIAHSYTEYTYPIQNKLTKGTINALKKGLIKQNMYLLSRFAEWEYYNMDVAMGAAIDLAKII